MSALQPLDPLLVVADLDPTLANTADAIAPDLLHALYGRALVVAYENGEIEGTHARQYMTAVVGQAYENLNAVKWGPAHFFMRLEDATTWQIRSQRAGMYGKIYPSKWLLAAMQQAYPARQHETYRPKWELLERLLNQHILQLLLTTIYPTQPAPQPHLLAMDMWDFCQWHAVEVRRNAIYKPFAGPFSSPDRSLR